VHSPGTWVRLRAYREPYRGAACALAACELDLEAMGVVRLGNVAPDATSVTADLPGCLRVVEVPEGAEVFVMAQLIYRRLQGAGPRSLLFANEDGPLEARYLANAIRCPITEVGVPLYSQQVERAELDAKRWANRWGLSVQEL
jgi:hypothetical protein